MIGLIFKKISFRNFMSFGAQWTDIDLSYVGTTQIHGENVDTGGASGAGKTTIFNALAFALYDKPVSNISKELMINTTNSKKDTLMEVKLEFVKDGIEYCIHRYRGSDYGIVLYIDGENKTPDSVSNTNKAIEKIVGISYDLFIRTVLFFGDSVGFLDLPVSTQRNLIEELFKITGLTDKAVKLKEKIKETDLLVNTKKTELTALEQAKSLRAKHLKQAEDRITSWEEDRIKNIDSLEQKIVGLSDINIEEEIKLSNKSKELKTSIDTLKNEISKIDRDILKSTKEIESLSSQLNKLKSGHCPYCEQEYHDKDKVELVSKKLDEEVKRLEEMQDVAEMKETLGALITEYDKNESIRKVTNVDELMNQNLIVIKIEELKNAVNPHLDAYTALLEEGEVNTDDVVSKIDEMNDRLKHQQFLLKLLTDKSSFIRKSILNKCVPSLNRLLNEYTQVLGLPHSFMFTTDMNCEIYEFGRELSYGNLSGGEKTRVNISMNLAFRDVMRQMHSPVNFMGADELDAGKMDPQSLDALIHLLKKKARDDEIGIWCVSHRQEIIGRLDREITVRKERGFSEIVE